MENDNDIEGNMFTVVPKSHSVNKVSIKYSAISNYVNPLIFYCQSPVVTSSLNRETYREIKKCLHLIPAIYYQMA